MAIIEDGATIWARKTIDSEIFTKPDKWFKIWFYLVNKANHKYKKQFERGQCFVKYEWIKEATGATQDQIKHCIEYLKKAKMLATQKATRGMSITIVNYDLYQNLDNYESHTKSHLKATQKPHRSHTINKNVKNEKNVKNKELYCPNSEEFRLSQLLFDLILQRKPDYKLPNLQEWSKHIDRMIRIDKRSSECIEVVIRWCQRDDFWQNNILSTEKLRKQFDQLDLKMSSGGNKQNDAMARFLEKRNVGK